MNVDWRKFAFYSGCGLLILAVGILIGSLMVYPDYQESKDTFYEMCLYTNKVTTLSNHQSGLVETYFDKPKNDIPRLNFFDCDDLVGRL